MITNIAYSNVTINMVKHFDINDLCRRSRPCRHTCTIELNDGRKVEQNLSAVEIYVLIHALSNKKITSKQITGPDTKHFDYVIYAFDDHEFTVKSPDTILTELFNNQF